jgi:hypothetical protein
MSEPLMPDEEAELRHDLHLDSPWARNGGGWPHVVARLLATLDAARAAAPSTPDSGLDVERPCAKHRRRGFAYTVIGCVDCYPALAAAHPQDPPETEKER